MDLSKGELLNVLSYSKGMTTDLGRKSSYTTQLQNWGFRKNLKDVTDSNFKIVSYKISKATEMGKSATFYFHGHRITPRILRGERFFLSVLEKSQFDNQGRRSQFSALDVILTFILVPPPRTPPGFHMDIDDRLSSSMSLDHENNPHLPVGQVECASTIVTVRRSSPIRLVPRRELRLDNLPWVEFQNTCHSFLNSQGGMIVYILKSLLLSHIRIAVFLPQNRSSPHLFLEPSQRYPC
jgi:hypothetical protein